MIYDVPFAGNVCLHWDLRVALFGLCQHDGLRGWVSRSLETDSENFSDKSQEVQNNLRKTLRISNYTFEKETGLGNAG